MIPTRIVAYDLETSDLKTLMGRILCSSFLEIVDIDFLKTVPKKYHPQPFTLRGDSDELREDDPADDHKLAVAIRDTLEKYNAIVTWNGKLFDNRFLNAKLLEYHERPLKIQFHYDPMWTVRNGLRIGSSKLVNVQKYLQLGEEKCVACDTPVLMADLTWRESGSLNVGDELMAFSEFPLRKRGRIPYERATVTAYEHRAVECVEVFLSSGDSVVTTRNHPWLCQQKRGGSSRWIVSENLKTTDLVKRPLRVWAKEESRLAGWLDGIYDGEGCITYHPHAGFNLTVSQSHGETCDKIRDTLQSFGFKFAEYKRHPDNGDKSSSSFVIRGGVGEQMRLLGSIRPQRLLSRFNELDLPSINGSGVYESVEAVEPVGVREIAFMSTSSKTFIANGYAMHNSEISWKNWQRAQCFDKAAMDEVVDHCERDVKVLTEAYWRLLPHAKTFPSG